MAGRRVAVLISGRGSNLQALIDASRAPDFGAEIVCALSDEPDAPGLARARAAGIPAHTVARLDHASRSEFERALDRRLQADRVELICLAGFMRILSPEFVHRWVDRILNIHPSLIPAFRGLDTHGRALAAGVRVHGCTVHLVRAELDAGPIVLQGVVPVLPEDDAAALAARVLEIEHHCYPLALAQLAAGRLRVVGGRVEGASPRLVLHPLLSAS